jgi:hypothetical protein
MSPFTVLTYTVAADEKTAVAETLDQLRRQAGSAPVQGGVLYQTIGYDPAQLQSGLAAGLPGVPFMGATECLAVGATGARFTRGRALVGWWLIGEGFKFAVAGVEKGKADATALGAQLATAALDAGKMPASSVRFAVTHPTPGEEELLLAGIYSRLDRLTPIIGGSAADNDLSGQWSTWTHQFVSRNGAVLGLCDWPWKIAINYQSGYLPTAKRGKVTRADGRRLYEIDGRPAAEVYDEWMGGKLKQFFAKGANVLAHTTMSPLGVTRGLFGGIEAYVLIHPEQVIAEDRSLTLFTRVKVGEDLVMMTSSADALVARGANVARLALGRAGLKPDQIVGGLLVYCGGCTLAIQDRMPEMLTEFERVLGKAPYVGYFSFGEQGCVLPRQVDHGNLMASVLLLSAS